MSLVFPQDKGLDAVVAESALVVVGAVQRLSDNDPFIHVRVERTLKGETAAAELEIRPCGWEMGCQVAASMANGGPSVSYALPILEGKSPEVKMGKSYVFFLLSNGELAAINAWRPASQADEVAVLVQGRGTGPSFA